MTLMEIELVLHYYWSPEEHPYAFQQDRAYKNAINTLIEAGLLELRVERDEHGANWRTTEKAAVYVEAVRAVPMPECKWVIPEA